MTEFEHTLLGLFRFAVLAASLTYYLTQSVLFAPLRKLLRGHSSRAIGYLVYCPSCIGTWIGLVLFFNFWPLHTLPAWQEALSAMFTSCLVSRLMPTDDVSFEINEWVSNDQKKAGQDGES
jgi:hypothetical protein